MIDPKDIKLLWMFTLRTEMYTMVVNKDTISSFLHGYDAGRDGKCDFIERLSNSIFQDYQIDTMATGWIGQIHLTASKLGADWVTTFKHQSFKILNEQLNGDDLKEFQDSFRKRIKGKATGFKVQSEWVRDWVQIVDLNSRWFRRIWSDRELQIIEEIEVELKERNYQYLDGQVSTTEKMKILCEQLYVELDQKEDKENNTY